MPQSSDALKNQWKEKIHAQSLSGLSIAAWCRQNHIAPHTFYYWRDKFLAKSIERTDFREISEQSSEEAPVQTQNAGIWLRYQEFSIHLDKQFDSSSFKECLKILMEVSC
jgi:transposase-like protein